CAVAGSTGSMTTGQIYCWGANTHGQLGDGTTTDRSTPVALSTSVVQWAQVSAGPNFACAVAGSWASSAKPYCWGANDRGQVGDGTTTERHAPVVISVSLSQFRQVSTGPDYACAVVGSTGSTTTGQIYCWGANGRGQLGDGTTTDRSTPVALSTTVTQWA